MDQNENARPEYSWALHLIPGRVGQVELSKGYGRTWNLVQLEFSFCFFLIRLLSTLPLPHLYGKADHRN